MKYFYKGNELYNVKKLKNSFTFHDIEANWKDPKENNKEKLGNFYLKDLAQVLDKKDFKQKVINWLSDNGITGKKIRVYDTPRYGLEVRIYGQPMEMPNSKSSFRRTGLSEDGKMWHGTRGIHSRKITMYSHINEKDFDNPEELQFILENIKTL